MRITIELPDDSSYQGTREWVLDEESDGQWWTIGSLRDDVRLAAKDPTLKATLGGADLAPNAIAIEALSEGATVVFVKE